MLLYHINISGKIHGIGFRAYVQKIAIEHKLVGTVRNIPEGVEIIVNDKDFMKKMERFPMLSRITSHNIEEMNIVGAKYKGFNIIESEY